MQVSEFVLHLFTPHHTNNHRPKVLHVDALFVYAALFVIFHFGVKLIHREIPNVLGYATEIYVEKLLEATNAKRQVAELAPLNLDSQLSAAAARKAADMFAKNYWSHSSSDGRTPWEFITESGYAYVAAGENLAKNFSDSQGVVEAWMASPTHRDNILKTNYRDVGFAVVNGILNGEETTLVVQMFGSRSKVVASAPAPSIVTPTAAQTEGTSRLRPATTVASAYSGVSIKPVVDISRLNHTVVVAFVGALVAILGLDAWIVSRRRIVRATGHNISHILFLIGLLLIVGSVQRGSLI